MNRLDAAWIPWSTNVRQHLLTYFPLPNGPSPLPDDVLLQPKSLLSLTESSFRHEINGLSNTEELSHHAPDRTRSLMQQSPIRPIDSLSVTLTENCRLTSREHWQDVRHLCFQSTSQINYVPGDVLTIYPQNSDQDVNQMLSCMGWLDVADQQIHFTYTRPSFEPDFDLLSLASQRTQPNLTLRQLLTNHLDLMAIPRRSFFSMIAHFTDNKMHKERLLEFTNPKYIDELYDYTSRPRRSVLEVLQEFESVKIPWQWAANVIPGLRGRQFSIASGGPLKASSDGQRHFELLVAIVKYKTVIQKVREGLCTRYLAGLEIGSSIEVTIQKGGLHIQKAEANRSVIMIGPGTGVAPMRSMIWERYQWQEELSKYQADTEDQPANGSLGIGETVLFYGGRNKEADYFFKDEWEYLARNMPLKVFTAFSRDQKAKVYVQDIMRQQVDLIYRILYFHRGTVYVCGSSGKMPSAVRAALVDIFRSSSDMDQSSAEGYLQDMEKEGRYKQETW